MKNTIYIFIRFLLLSICYIPLGLLMFIGKPARLEGLLFDIENFIGLESFVNVIFFGACIFVGFETARLLFKRKKNKYIPLFLLLILFGILYFYSVEHNIFYKKAKDIPTKVTHNTLLIATEGSIYNYNTETNKIAWDYSSELDSEGNRNSFVVNEQNIFMPFESGKLVNFNINSGGEIIWKQQVYGRESNGIEITLNNEVVNVDNITPLFMSQPLVDNKNVVIASHGYPRTTTPLLYNFNKATGKIIWKERLPTHFNLFAPPVKYKSYPPYDYYFVNSAVYLEKYGAETGSRYTYGMFEDEENYKHFENPIYAQMQTDGKNIYIGDENGKFYCLPLNEDGSTINNLDLSDPENTFIKNPSVFKWTFTDENFTFQSSGNSFLENNILYTVVKNGSATKSAVFAINTNDGTLKWKKIIEGSILNWTLINNEIIGSTSKTIFYLNEEDYQEFNITRKPLSNIELLDENCFIYITESGIEVFDVNKQKASIIYDKKFNNNSHNTAQLKYISK